MQLIVRNHGTEEKAILNVEGEYAMMMCIIQIGETVNKISNHEISERLPVSKIVGLRNRIVHGCAEVDRVIITEVLKKHIPELETIVVTLLGDIHGN